MTEARITIQTVKGGFIVTVGTEEGGTTEIATSVGKAMRIAKTAVEQYSQVKKEETAEDAPAAA